MRKLMVGLVAIALLAVAAPAIAQQADPLGLIASGAVLPYVGSGNVFSGSMSFLELAAPVFAAPRAHAFFFDVNCNKGPNSLGLGLTANDLRVQRIDNTPGNPTDGLITIAQASSGLAPLEPLDAPLHARVLWVMPGANLGRVLEPIAISHFEIEQLGNEVSSTDTAFTWNPLRTAATFHAPLEGGGTTTSLLLVCPDSNIVSVQGSDPNLPAFPAGGITGLFPQLVPPAAVHPATTGLDILTYDTDENLLVNLHTTCSCLTLKKIATDISGGAVYADATQAPDGTYTEIVGGFNTAFPAKCVTSGGSGSTFCKRFSFTGYRSIRVTPTLPSFDLFGRLNNGNVCNINADDTRCNSSITTGTKPEDPLDFLR